MGVKFTIAFILFSNCYLNFVNAEPLPKRLLKQGNLLKTCRCGIVNDPLVSRIVGGKQTPPHKYPWLAQIHRDKRFHCGGAVINDNYIMTAGHCALNDNLNRIGKESLSVIVGVYDNNNLSEPTRQNFRVTNIKIPTAFYSDYLHDVHDIALFKLDKRIRFSKQVSPVCLPVNNAFKYTGHKAIISGWGVRKPHGSPSQYPFETKVEIINDNTCKNVSLLGKHFAEDTMAMFCAYSRFSDACQGDSGGPLIVEEDFGMSAIGIISWGLKCAQQGIPGVYTRLTYYLDWIIKNTADAKYCSY